MGGEGTSLVTPRMYGNGRVRWRKSGCLKRVTAWQTRFHSCAIFVCPLGLPLVSSTHPGESVYPSLSIMSLRGEGR